LQAICECVAAERPNSSRRFAPELRFVLLLGIALAVLQQTTGINVFLYYAPEIFKKLGTVTNLALLQTIVVGGVNLAATLLAIGTVDRWGRKPLMIGGASGMAICLLTMGAVLQFQGVAAWVLLLLLGYVACFALSVGPVTWVILSEIFPNNVRSVAMSLATFALWTTNFLVSQTFPMMDENPWLVERFHHGFPFYVYGLLCAVLVAVTWLGVPETKGRSLEEIERLWTKRTHHDLQESATRHLLEDSPGCGNRQLEAILADSDAPQSEAFAVSRLGRNQTTENLNFSHPVTPCPSDENGSSPTLRRSVS